MPKPKSPDHEGRPEPGRLPRSGRYAPYAGQPSKCDIFNGQKCDIFDGH